MTDNTRVSDGNSAAAPRMHSDNFDRTELFNSFGKTASGQSSLDTTRNSTDLFSFSTSSSDKQFNKSDATNTNALETNSSDKANGERTSEAGRRSGANEASESLNVSNVFAELGLTRGLTNQGIGLEGNSNRPAEGNANLSPLKSAEQQIPQISFFDSANNGASISSRVEVSPQRHKGRDQQPGSRRDQPVNRSGDRIENAQKIELAKPQTGLQVENLGSSKEFANKVQKQIGRLTPATREALERSGTEIITTDKLTTLRPDLAGKEPYNQSGARYENLDAFFIPQSNSVILAETRENKAGKTVLNDRVEGVFNHEVGHALDKSLGDFSQSPEFIEAHKKDIENFNGFDKGFFSYLIGSKDGDGKKETFAEVWGALNGASSDPRDSKLILDKFPNVANLIKDKLPQHIKSKSQ